MLDTYMYVYDELGRRLVFDLVLAVVRILVICGAVVLCLVLAPCSLVLFLVLPVVVLARGIVLWRGPWLCALSCA